MKNFAKLALAAAVVLPTVFVGCKKGENDPFLSFRSRKGRVAGEWKVTEGSGTMSDNSVGSTPTTWTYNGSTYTVNGQSDPQETTTMNYTFEKDGTYTSSIVSTNTSSSPASTYSETESGTWNFLGGVGETKSKSQIIMSTLSRTTSSTPNGSSNTTTYTGHDAPSEIWDIDQLKNKEMIVKSKGSYTSGSYTSSNESSMTLTQE